MIILVIFDPNTGDSKTMIHKKFTKRELDDVTRYPKDCITEPELLRGYHEKYNVHTEDT